MAQTPTAGVPPPATAWATKTDVAYNTLRGRILDGTLEPGAVIGQELVAAELGVSTTPLREALRRLEAEGFLRQLAHREMRVASLSAREIDEIYQVRLQLDPFAVSIGAERASDARREEVRAMREYPTGVPLVEVVNHHKQMFRLMYSAADNQTLTELLDGLWDRSGRYLLLLVGDMVESGVRAGQQHEVIDAFVAGHGRLVGDLVTKQLTRSRETLVERLTDEA